jgi:hypothetical protein
MMTVRKADDQMETGKKALGCVARPPPDYLRMSGFTDKGK